MEDTFTGGIEYLGSYEFLLRLFSKSSEKRQNPLLTAEIAVKRGF
jgi:hypothetical protein